MAYKTCGDIKVNGTFGMTQSIRNGFDFWVRGVVLPIMSIDRESEGSFHLVNPAFCDDFTLPNTICDVFSGIVLLLV